MLKDVVARHNIRNVRFLENIIHFIFDNVGSVFSAKSIADYLKSQRINIGVNSVQNYVEFLCETFMVNKVKRFDLRGKRVLELFEKYFLGDIGFRHAIRGFREADISGILENIVYLELLRRGYKLNIGKLNGNEVDFIAEKENDKIYVQVAYLLTSQKTIEREFSALQGINDNYPKFVISMDENFGGDFEGIKRLNIVDWLINDD